MKYVHKWIAEGGMFVWYVVGGLLGYVWKGDSVEEMEKPRGTIVFVHGWLTQNPPYLPLKRQLERTGFAVYMTNFGVQTGSIKRYARRLADFIREKDLRDVVLVGASQGGLIGLWYLQKLAGWERVARFVSIGTPYGGSPVARIPLPLQSLTEMRPGSEFLAELFSEPVMHIDNITCIVAERDEIVPGRHGVLDDAKTLTTPTVGHAVSQAARQTGEAVIRTLEV